MNKSVSLSLAEHWDEGKRGLKPWQPVCILLQGSQNYGMEIEGSDVDTKFVLAPTFEEIAMAKKPISTTRIRENEEHIDMKDVRLMLQTYKKQNMNFVETLFTKYKIVNPLYQEQWDRLVREREVIARLSPWAALKTMKGVALEKQHAMEHEYPSKMAILAKYGYDPKQLHHILRIKDFVRRYLAEEPYESCLRPRDPEHLKDVKRGLYNLDQARITAAAAIEDIVSRVDGYCTTHEPTINPVAVDLIDDVQYQIMKIAVEKELS